MSYREIEGYDIHHKKPQCQGGKNYVNGYRNTIEVPRRLHVAYHILFGTMSAQEVCKFLNEVWINPEHEFICVPRPRNNVKKKRRHHGCS